jgi:hypothetical protein
MAEAIRYFHHNHASHSSLLAWPRGNGAKPQMSYPAGHQWVSSRGYSRPALFPENFFPPQSRTNLERNAIGYATENSRDRPSFEGQSADESQ